MGALLFLGRRRATSASHGMMKGLLLRWGGIALGTVLALGIIASGSCTCSPSTFSDARTRSRRQPWRFRRIPLPSSRSVGWLRFTAASAIAMVEPELDEVISGSPPAAAAGASGWPFKGCRGKQSDQGDWVCTSIASVPAQSRAGAARQAWTSLNPASSRAASQRASDQVVMRVPT